MTRNSVSRDKTCKLVPGGLSPRSRDGYNPPRRDAWRRLPRYIAPGPSPRELFDWGQGEPRRGCSHTACIPFDEPSLCLFGRKCCCIGNRVCVVYEKVFQVTLGREVI